jgi:hypothetical protein
LSLAVSVLCSQSGRCVGHVEATAARGGVCLGRSAREFRRRAGRADRRRVRARSRCLVARARARTRAVTPRKARKREARDARFRLTTTLARTSGGRVVCSRRDALGKGRDVADRGGSVKFGLVPGHRGGDGEASPGAVCGDRHDARRVLTQRGGCGTDGVMVQYSPEGQWFGSRKKERCPLGSFASRVKFGGSNFSRDRLAVSG